MPMSAVWDLRVKPTTFDFATWLPIVKTAGCDEVVFIDGPIAAHKYPPEIAWRRYEHILMPLCDLIGMPHRMAKEAEGLCPAYHYGTAVQAYEKLGWLEKYPLIPAEMGDYVTVTLRESFRNQHRNASPDWDKVIADLSKETEVIVLRDCEAEPIPIVERMLLYSNARMNFGASNGPLALCHFSAAPYLTFNMVPREHAEEMRQHLLKTGFPEGSQFPFRTDRQALVWEPDDYDVIMREWDKWR